MFFSEVFIGIRHLLSKRNSSFVSVTTLISVLGIGLGVMALIVVVGVMTGFEKELRRKILGMQSHIVVSSLGSQGILKWRELSRKINLDQEVISSSPFIYGQVMFSSRGRVIGAVVKGISINKSSKKDFAEIMPLSTLNKIRDLKKKNKRGVILGSELASKLALEPGDTVKMISPIGKVTPMGLIPRTNDFVVAGIFKSGFYQYDVGLSFISLQGAQEFFGLGNYVSGLHVRVGDIFLSEKISKRIKSRLGGLYEVRSWQTMNQNLFSALKTEKTTMTILLMLVVIVAAFNIAGSLVMVVMEKGKDIAILKSMGATKGFILRLFFFQGAFIGFIGTMIGIFLGLLLGWNLHFVESFLEKFFGFEILPASIYHIDKLPIEIQFFEVTIISILSILVSLVATVYPAWRASSIDPIDELRFG